MRDFGNTNVAQYAVAPAVGVAGATYFHTVSKILYVSDGVSWLPQLAGGSGAGGDLTGTYPNPTIGALAVGNAEINDVAWGKVTGVPTATGDMTGVYPALQIAAGAITDADVTSVGYAKITGAPTSLPPNGAAGGNLAGTYPNPTILASAVRGTPTAGGTAREIAKTSIWANEDLINYSIGIFKMAPSTSVPQRVSGVGIANAQATTGTPVTFASVPITVRVTNVPVLITTQINGMFAVTGATWTTFRLHLFRDVTEIWSRDFVFNLPGAAWMATPDLVFVDMNVPALTMTYSMRASVQSGAGATVTCNGPTPGAIWAYEMC